MTYTFYVAAAVAIFATVMTITRLSAVHALLYLVVSLISIGIVFYTLGAPFVAVLELIIYAGAIMVLFVFVVMMLNLGERSIAAERELLSAGIWTGPAILALILVAELGYIASARPYAGVLPAIEPQEVGLALYGPYLLGVELTSMLLMAGLVGAYHLGWRKPPKAESADVVNTDQRRADTGGDPVRTRDDRFARTP